MKQILLLAAIYSLIIHQSNKKARVTLPVPTNITRAVIFKNDAQKKSVPQANLITKNAGYVSKNSFTRINEQD